MKLTKQMLLKGKDYIQTITLQNEVNNEKNGEISIRLLTQSEVNQYNELSVKGLGIFNTREKNRQTTSEGKINLEKVTKSNQEAQAYAVAQSLSCEGEEYSIEDVLSIGSAVFNEIWEEVKELNHLDSQEEIEKEVDSFHKKE